MPESTPDDAPPLNEPRGVRLGPGVVLPDAALRFTAVRSSGPGGQNVNKRATKVELRVALEALREAGLSAAALARLRRLGAHVFVQASAAPDGPQGQGELVITAQDTRSQQRNREACLDRLRHLVQRALAPPKPRHPTKPGRGAIERRLQTKREASEKKSRRRWRAE